jgi:hypothetical protein
METNDNLDLATFIVKFDRIFEYVEQNLLVDFPVAADPVGDQIGFGNLQVDLSVSYYVVEGVQGFENHLAHR